MTILDTINKIIKLEQNQKTIKDANLLKDKLSPSDYMLYLNITNQVKY